MCSCCELLLLICRSPQIPAYVSNAGGCWNDRYEVFDWSNIVCAHMQHPMAGRLDRLSFRNML